MTIIDQFLIATGICAIILLVYLYRVISKVQCTYVRKEI